MFVSLKQAPVRNRNSRTGVSKVLASRILELLGFSLKTSRFRTLAKRMLRNLLSAKASYIGTSNMMVFARSCDSGKLRCYFGGASGIWALLIILGCLHGAERCQAQSFQDIFTNRETIITVQGSLTGNNTTATVETGEPLHGGKTGGHSLWVSWVAPTNGVATFETDGSGFDTLLGVYYFPSTNDTALTNL